jgi:hypothetical protein
MDDVGTECAPPAHSVFPCRTFDKLWHVGSMDISQKCRGSHEGRGLSVSVNPTEWQQINPGTSGDLWTLVKPLNRFLDFHTLAPDQKKQMVDWGLKHDFVALGTLYRVTSFDSELDEDVYMDFVIFAEAEEESMDGGSITTIDDGLLPIRKVCP